MCLYVCVHIYLYVYMCNPFSMLSPSLVPKHETRFINAESLKTAIGRYINDACDGYTDALPDKFKTPFYTNCGYRYALGSVGPAYFRLTGSIFVY